MGYNSRMEPIALSQESILPFTDEHRMVRDTVSDFAQAELRPKAKELDKTKAFPWENFHKMAELGLLAPHIPEDYGGMGMDLVAFTIIMEEVAKACGSTALTLAAHTSLCAYPIYMFASDAQKRKYLPNLCAGKTLGAFGLTEPEAGSDAGATKTLAKRAGDKFLITGAKMFITNGGNADVLIITARHDDTGKISNFIIEKGYPGFKAGKDEDKLGLRASQTSQLFFDNCEVPAENLMGDEGAGFKQFLATLDEGRIVIGALALGIAGAAYEDALKYSKERIQFGKPIASFQTIQGYLADMAMEIEAARLLVYHAAFMMTRGMKTTKESAFAKLFASEMAMRVTNKAVQIHGGYGYTSDFAVERYYRDVKLCEIGEGTSEIQRLVIAREIIGKL